VQDGEAGDRFVTLQSDRLDDGSRLHLYASLETDGSLRISGHDLGPVAKNISPDGEYEYWYSVAAEDVPALVVALGGSADGDVIDLLREHWSGMDSYGLGAAVRSSGVAYHFASYP
jgi:hypothetical protein